ncbi:thiol:disulfide interchange protein DsbG [Acidithiobacillus ferrianus]|uniref:Thiol:disulfide interchange protein n=2 Tax=Acidithiobacillus ferrianus TaxID=2678518 RepID=A0A845U5Y7_9PROT|nr:thiol:disulfide interchange protein DsbG [Acidithiobacillus ferrianus]NDU43032.1 thiol:disulfide interchange protein DsbG [Acidithiobacillus ferrianus]
MQKKSIALAIGLFVVGGLSGMVLEHFRPIVRAHAEVSLGTAQKLFDAVTHGRAKADKVFSGPGGLTGVEVDFDGHKTVAFITADGKYLVAGPVLNAQGNDQGHAAMIRLGLVPKPMRASALAKETVHADSFVLGTGGPEITAFVDPNCIFCHKFYERAQPLIAAGKLRIRYLVVGFLKPSSEAKAAAILGAPNPAAAMAENEKGFVEATEEGGIQPDEHASAATISAVRDNTRLLSESGEIATPTLIYCDQKGAPRLIHGLPKGSLKDFAGHIGNLQNGVCRK